MRKVIILIIVAIIGLFLFCDDGGNGDGSLLIQSDNYHKCVQLDVSPDGTEIVYLLYRQTGVT